MEMEVELEGEERKKQIEKKAEDEPHPKQFKIDCRSPWLAALHFDEISA
jgi:hypothetical protein